jgi:hypothetical protein
MLELNEGEAETALVGIDRAILEHRAAVAEEPRNAEFRSHIRQWHACRVMALLRLARWRDTLDQLREFDAAYSDENSDACGRLRASSSAPGSCNPTRISPTPNARASATNCATQSVEQLRELVAKGKDPEQLAHDDGPRRAARPPGLQRARRHELRSH